MKEVELLWNLQELEQELEKINGFQKKNSLAGQSRKLAQELEQINKTLILEQEALLLEKRNLKAAELDLQGSAAEKKEAETQLYSGNINQTKELELLQDKLENLKLIVAKKEEVVVDLMEAIEQKESLIKGQEELLQKRQQEYQEQEGKKKVLEEKIRKRVAFLGKKKQEINSLLTPETIKKYENLQKKFVLGGIAKLKGSICQGCYISLPTGIIQKISAEGGLHTCENCGRFLWVYEAENS